MAAAFAFVPGESGMFLVYTALAVFLIAGIAGFVWSWRAGYISEDAKYRVLPKLEEEERREP